jgi:Asp-tRNA(Asn)/Glu-tRNA(Gln) amidotransferase A subunit family amidase
MTLGAIAGYDPKDPLSSDVAVPNYAKTIGTAVKGMKIGIIPGYFDQHIVSDVRAAVDEALKRLDQFDWLVFSSANGVRYFFDRLISQGRDVRALGGSRIAAIGPATDRALARYYLRADLIPDEYRAEALRLRFLDRLVHRRHQHRRPPVPPDHGTCRGVQPAGPQGGCRALGSDGLRR